MPYGTQAAHQWQCIQQHALLSFGCNNVVACEVEGVRGIMQPSRKAPAKMAGSIGYVI
jgi:hypothetical protein